MPCGRHLSSFLDNSDLAVKAVKASEICEVCGVDRTGHIPKMHEFEPIGYGLSG